MRASQDERAVVWSRLAADLPLDLLDSMTEVKPLSEILSLGEQILSGQIRGRVVVDVTE